MSDQRRNVGNIGDVFKHAVLPELVLLWLKNRTCSEAPTYVETHAGEYAYSLEKLKRKSDYGWSGERAWSIGILADSSRGSLSGTYGTALRYFLEREVYPGSMRLVEFATKDVLPRLNIRGFDICARAIRSYPDKHDRVVVEKTDGYLGASNLPEPKIVFNDPFWGEGSDVSNAKNLLSEQHATIVWYPLFNKLSSFRKWLCQNRISHAELEFQHYDAPSPWAGQDLRGSGIAYSNIPGSTAATLGRVGEELQHAFRGQRCGERRLDLSFRQTP